MGSRMVFVVGAGDGIRLATCESSSTVCDGRSRSKYSDSDSELD